MPLEGLVGSVASLWRYPVKSMLGEKLLAAELTDRGLLGDRAYALVDSQDGKVVSAKNPRKWPRLLELRAAFLGPVRPGAPLPSVGITLPDGSVIASDDPTAAAALSRALGREVSLHTADQGQRQVEARFPLPRPSRAEAYWPDIDGLDSRDAVTDFGLPEGTFFDSAVLHLLTTSTLGRLGELCPRGRFEERRFRPNVVVQAPEGAKDFVEDTWIGCTVQIGDEVRLSIDRPCHRCVMTTLAQGDLPKDLGILRTAAEHHHARVGVYASVVRGGTVRRGDVVRLD